MIYYEIKIECDAGMTEEVENFLVINGIYDYFVTDPKIEEDILTKMNWLIKDERDVGNAFITICAENFEKGNEIYNLVNDNFKATIREACDDEWKDNWKQFARTVRIDDSLVIQPAWVDYDKKDNEQVIVLDSGAAFGTGTHETTHICSVMLRKYISENTKVLDIGTGSGILAIISALSGAKEVVATDIDEVACETAKINISKNNCEKIVDVRRGNLLECVNEDEKFDLISANIIVDVLLILFSDVKKVMKKDGILIMSGILEERVNEILQKAEEEGFELFEKQSENDWCGLCFKIK